MPLAKNTLTPQQIIQQLDTHVIGQKQSKQKLAIALRQNSMRPHVAMDPNEIIPNNILMIGPTGVGKTELARRLATITNLPFVKVEATQFTEVGYVGQSVDNIIHVCVQKAIDLVKKEKEATLKKEIEEAVVEQILNKVIPPIESKKTTNKATNTTEATETEIYENAQTRALFRIKIKNGELDGRLIELEIQENPGGIGLISGGAIDESMMITLGNIMNKFMPPKTKKRKTTIGEAKEILRSNELEKLTSTQSIQQEAIIKAENSIVFIDEIDKIISTAAKHSGPDVSRGGVQQDLLSLLEGSNVVTKIGPVRTNGMLFIAAGAFHQNKPDELMPELQGRLPIWVYLQSLEKGDYEQILLTPKNSLIKQQKALLATEDITLNFTDDAIKAMASAAYQLNIEKQNIGARRLRTIMSTVLEEIYLKVPEEIKPKSNVTIDGELVEKCLHSLLHENSMKNYLL